MAFLNAVRKRWATRQYVRKLPNLLRRDYGFSQSYTPQQIRRTIERNGLNADYSCYAICMFSDRSAFDQYHQALGEDCNFESMRSEVAASHFGGNSHFTVSEMFEASSHASHGAEAGAIHGAAGGHGHSHGGTGH